MFQILHRIYVLSWTTLLLGGLIWLYPRTGISEPLVDWYAVWQNHGESSIKPIGELSGTVIKVPDGASLMLRGTDRHFYSIGLLSLTAPPFKPNTPQEELARRSKERLSEVVLSNEVQVTLTWLDPHRRGVGVVHLGSTNVNALLVEAGLVHFNRKFIRGLPLLDQYALVRAERRARQAREAAEPAEGEGG